MYVYSINVVMNVHKVGIKHVCPFCTFLFFFLWKVCEAGLHISLGVGLRLFKNLVHDCQNIDLQLALLSSEHRQGVSDIAVQLLQQAQQLEIEVKDQIDTVGHHQAVYELFATTTNDQDQL